MNRTRKLLASLVLASMLGGVLAGCSGFGDSDLESIRAAIREEYGTRDGVTVTEVFIELNNGLPAGYVKFTLMGYEYLHTCSTTVFDNGQYTWQCQP